MTADPLYRALPNTAGLQAPAVLLDYQQAWIADGGKFKVAEKSRRVGLTWAEAADNVLIAAQDRSDGGQTVYYIGYNMDMAVEYIEACAMWARQFNRAASAIEEGEEIFSDEKDAEQRIKTYVIRFPSGFRIVALSSRPANLRGKQGVVVIDEAAFHHDLAELIKAAMALLFWGGKVRVLSTHNGEGNEFNELVNDIRAGKRRGIVHRIEFRKAVEQGLYQRICLRLGEEWSPEQELAWIDEAYGFYGSGAAEELDVIPSAGQGAYLTRAQIVATQRDDIPVLRWECGEGFAMLPRAQREAECQLWCEQHLAPALAVLDPARTHFYGCDFARIADLSSMWPVSEQQDCSLDTPFVVELRNVPYDQQRQSLFYFVRGLPNFRGGAHDATGNGGYLAEVAAQEFGAARIQQVMLSVAWYRENMPRFRAHFEDGTITTPADADILGDLRSVRRRNGVASVPNDVHTVGADGNKRHGDSAVALALAMYAVEMIDAGPIEFIEVPSQPRGLENASADRHRLRDRADDDFTLPEPRAW